MTGYPLKKQISFRLIAGPAIFAVFLLLLFFASQVVSAQPEAAAGVQQVYVIPLKGDVEPSMAFFLNRALRDTGNSPEALYVFEIDTFGGRVDSAFEIADILVDVPAGKTIAFVQNKAISAGALIALACNELYMRPNSTIGDVAPITQTNEGPKVMGEKFQSPLRAKFRSLAKRNGYPERLAESMVTEEMEVFQVAVGEEVRYMDSTELAEFEELGKGLVQSKKTIVGKDELLTMDDSEAFELGFSQLTAEDLDAVMAHLGIHVFEVVRLDQSWSENLGRFVGTIAPILLMLGLASLYTEMKVPGFGLPGIIALFCLGLVFLNQYLMGLADYVEFFLIVIGILLIGIEILVLPGFGIAGPLGFLCIGVGLILSFQDFVVPDPAAPWQMDLLVNNALLVLGSFVVAFILAFVALRFLLPRLGTVIDGPYLQADLREARDLTSAVDKLSVGDTGITLTLLRPSGKADFNGEIYDVLSENEFIHKESKIKVKRIKGNKVIVSRREET